MSWTLRAYESCWNELDSLTDGSMCAEDCVSQAARERAVRLTRVIKWLSRRQG